MADELTRSIKIPVTDGLSLDMELPTAAARANSFLAFDATGEPTVVTAGSPGAPTTMTRQQFSGTGSQVAYTLASDPGALGNSCEVFVGGIYQQRDTYTIAGTTLTFTAAPVAGTDNIEVVNFLTTAIGTTDSSLVTYVPAGTSATQRTVQAKLRDVVSVKDFGAVGDGVTDDTAAIQAAITACAGTSGKSVYFPAGDYYISAAINIPNYTSIIGDGVFKSRINLQGKPYGGVVFQNSDVVTWGWFKIQDFGIRGGTYAIRNNAPDQEQWDFTDVNFEIQTIAGIYSNQNFQINNLNRVVFYGLPNGIIVNSGFANLNNYHKCRFEIISNKSISFNTVTAAVTNNFFGCRFEAGGLASLITIDLLNATGTIFSGCYFEATHEILLNSSNSYGTRFDNCFFAGWGVSLLSKYVFNTSDLVVFNNNSWYTGSDGSTRIEISGNNENKLGKNNKIVNTSTKQNQSFVGISTAVPAAGTTINTISFSRTVISNTLVDISSLFGTMTVTLFEVTTAGFSYYKTITIPITVYQVGASLFTTTFGTQVVQQNTTTNPVTFTFAVVGQTITVAVAGLTATPSNACVSWKWDSISTSNPGYNNIISSIA
jgi:hypothetical protein